MQKIAITGGKGGTGKSTIATLFSYKFFKKGKRVVLCDLDVEGPSIHYLLGREIGEKIGKLTRELPLLIKEKCKRCGLCGKACLNNAIFAPEGRYPRFLLDLCSGCGACWTVCPYGAIVPQKEKIGDIYKQRLGKGFWLINGELRPGIEEPGPSVGEVKKKALELARSKKADFVIFDTAAGTHCSVIRALLGVEKAYCVTEPTPMGAHDLALILELCKKLDVPAEIILNRSDLGDEKPVLNVARDFNLKIKKRIPHSLEVVEKYSSGTLQEVDLDL